MPEASRSFAACRETPAFTMCRGYRPILLAFVTLLVNGLTYGQDSLLYCETFCLSSQTTCTCTLGQSSTQWEVKDASGTLIGQSNVDINTDTTLSGNDFAAASFAVTVINSTSGTYISELRFTTLSEYQGYEIECRVDGDPHIRTISVAGPPTVADIDVTTATSDSVTMTIESSISSDCVANYTVVTNASAPSSVNDSSLTVSRPPDGTANATYSVCVSAVDFAGRTGPQYCLEDCLRLSPPNAVSFTDDVSYPSLSNDGCSARIEWTPDSCLPLATSYNVTINSSSKVVMRNVVASEVQISSVAYGEEYTVTVTPSNTFGFGVPESFEFTAPTDCPVMMAETSASPTSGSASLLFPGPGILSVGFIAGFVISFGYSITMF